MPDNIGNQLQGIAQEALNNFLLQECDNLIKEHVQAIRKILEIPWAFRLGRDVYPRFLGELDEKENDSSTTLTLEEIEWCMKRLAYTQLTLAKAFADLHEYRGGNPEALGLPAYDDLFKGITKKHETIFEKLKVRHGKLKKKQDALRGRNISQDQPIGGVRSFLDDNLDFLLGALDSATSRSPSSYGLWHAGPSYYEGYLAESALKAIPQFVQLAEPAVRATGQILTSGVEAGIQDIWACGDCSGDCKCDEDCFKCCGGGCGLCGGGAAKVAGAAGTGASIGGDYIDPASAAAQTTTPHAGLFSHATWSHFFAHTIGSAITFIYTLIAGLPVLYNFGHSLISKLIGGGEREATASRDRWSAVSDLSCSTSVGALFFFAFLALLGPHAAISALILGFFIGDRVSKYVRRKREREEMGGISKPGKWVPDRERIENLGIEKTADENEPGAGPVQRSKMMEELKKQPEIKHAVIQRLLERNAKEKGVEEKVKTQAGKIDEERLRLEAISQTSYGCYRIAQAEKKAAVSQTDCYSALFSHYEKPEEYKRAVGFAQALNSGAGNELGAAEEFVREYKYQPA